jgi:hypothetical protein
MTSTYTNLGIEKPGSGDYSNTWDVPANANYAFLDEAIAGVTAIGIADTNTTLTVPDGTSSNNRKMVIEFTGALTANRDITFAPSDLTKIVVLKHSMTGGFNLIIKQGTGATPYTLPAGKSAIIYLTGANAVYNALADATMTSLAVTTLTATSGTVGGSNIVVATRAVNTSGLLTGGGDLSSDRTISISAIADQTIVGNVSGGSAVPIALTGTQVASALPAASETLASKIEIATQAETNTGTDDARAITPLKLRTTPIVTLGAAAITGQTNDPTPDPAADYVLTYDASATSLKKALISTISGTGRLLAVVTFTASGTYTKNANANYVEVEVLGGGGSAGTGKGGGSVHGSGGPGSGGGYAFKRILNSSLGATETVTIGAGGVAIAGSTGGAAVDGNDGGTTSFGAHCQATGGQGGVATTGGQPDSNYNSEGGVGSGGDINLRGEPGVLQGANSIWGTYTSAGGKGAGPIASAPAKPLQLSSAPATHQQGNSADANSGGGGAPGLTSYNAATYTAGAGAGGSGYVVVKEYA